jgi:ADP-ribosylglycohydrolase
MTDRVFACLAGLATGDAIGKQSETLSHDAVVRWYPHGIHGFEGSPGDVIPRYARNTKRRWLIGETTDDTERTLALARAILRDGEVHHDTVGRELLACSKCVHPGLKSLWQFHQAANPSRVTDEHDGCGAATRVAPVGILYKSHRLDEIVNGAREASISTHGGPLALAAAAATAAAVSAAIDGAAPDEIVEFAQHAATRAERARSNATDVVFAPAIRVVHRELSLGARLDAGTIAERFFPATPLTIVPLAIALSTLLDSAETAILLAANIGGDADSVASIAGAILGGRCPRTVNDHWLAVVEKVNGHGLAGVAAALSQRRD